MKSLKIVLSVLPFVLSPFAFAADHEVQMLNKGPDGQRMWFEPAIVVAEPGDTITFISVDRGHNSQSIMIPDGAEGWKGKFSKDLQITVTAEGVYAYKCTPHYGMGMVGFIIVGDPSVNIDAVEGIRYPGRSKKVAAELIGQIKDGG
ncbi:MAG: pseudoazurin [Pseudomonadota bacterium]